MKRIEGLRWARLALTSVLCAALACAAISLSGCEKHDLEKARRGADAVLSSLAAAGSGAASEADVQAGLQTLSQLCKSTWFFPQDYGVSYGAFAGVYFADYVYSIDDVRLVKNDAGETVAVATIIVPCIAQEDLLRLLQGTYSLAMADGSIASQLASVSLVDADDIAASWPADGLFLDVCAANPPTRFSMTFEMVLVKSGGAWVPENYETLGAFIFGGLDPKQELS